MLANRLNIVIQKLIHLDQSGFIIGRSTIINLGRLFLQIPSDNVGNRAILSLDAAKAFDCFEWTYLWEVLEKFGLGSGFVR